MANIADGLIEVEPVSQSDASELRQAFERSLDVFSYGGIPDFNQRNDIFSITFTGRWTCDSAWDKIDLMMSDTATPAAKILIAASIRGLAQELGAGYRAKVGKDSGALKLRRFRK